MVHFFFNEQLPTQHENTRDDQSGETRWVAKKFTKEDRHGRDPGRRVVFEKERGTFGQWGKQMTP